MNRKYILLSERSSLKDCTILFIGHSGKDKTDRKGITRCPGLQVSGKRRVTTKGDQGIFESDGTVLHIDYSGSCTTECICQCS